MIRRLLLVLAIGAALVGAPSHASAASNTLLGAEVTPTSGTTATSFVFTVRYEGRFAATRVEATAGPTAVALVRISGTALDGAWRGSSHVPAGTWPVTFAAVALQGSAPSLAGPTLTVVPDAPAATAPSTSSPLPGAGGSTIDSTTSGAGGTASSPSLAPAAPIASPSPPAAQLPVATAAPSTTRALAPGQPVTTVPGAPTPMSAPGGPGASGNGGAGPAARVASAGASGAPISDVPGGATQIGSGALFLGLAGMALVAISGGGLLLIAGRRRRSATPDGADLDDATATTAAAAVERRALRRARMRLDEDPIVAAMGLPATHSAAERRVRRAEKRDRSG